MNEVLIDGDPDATEEFVEIHNTTSERINFAGLEILSNRGNELAMRVKFKQGCIEKKGMLFSSRNSTGGFGRRAPFMRLNLS